MVQLITNAALIFACVANTIGLYLLGKRVSNLEPYRRAPHN